MWLGAVLRPSEPAERSKWHPRLPALKGDATGDVARSDANRCMFTGEA